MLELTFLVGENRTRMTTRRLTHPSIFNELMKEIQVVREFSRRVRELDFAVLKAQELRNIVLFFWATVVQCLESDAKERRLWFLLAFMVRACVIPEIEFENVEKNEITNASKCFYVLFEKLFSSKNCTYSIHVFLSHIMEIRSQGPFPSTSAFPFENLYGEIRKSFTPGTMSTLKQIFEKIYLRRSLSYHTCEKTIFFSPKETSMENNSLIYVYENEKYNMYKIISIDKENPNILVCNVQGRIELEFADAADVNWSSVGVFREGATGQEIIEIDRGNVHGKVLKVSSLLMTCPNSVLREV